MFTWIKSHKVISLLIVLVASFGIYRYTQSKKIEYVEYAVEKNNIQDTLELSGKVEAGSSATLRFGAGGLVTYLGTKEGDTVKKWQTLASIDTRQLQKTLEQKLNLYAIERGEFDQGQDDYRKNIDDGDISQTLRRLLEKNQYQLDNTVKDVEYQDLSLKLSRLTSPIAGVLIHAPIKTTGVQVMASDTWTVVDPTSLYFSADLDETDLKRVAVGQKVVVTLDAYPEREINSFILSISYTPKETSAGTTYEVKIALPPSEVDNLRLGLNGTASIILVEKDNVWTVPASALSTKNGDIIVYLKSGNKYEEKIVETGIENGGVVEIFTDLGEPDYVYSPK